MPSVTPAGRRRAGATLLALVALSSCGSNSPTGTAHDEDGRSVTVRIRADSMAGVFAYFNLPVDRIVVGVVPIGQDTLIASQTFSALDLSQHPAYLELTIPLVRDSQPVRLLMNIFAGGVPYFYVADSGMLRRGRSFDLSFFEILYDGPGRYSDTVHFTLDTVITTGDSVLLTAQAVMHEEVEPGVPLSFWSLDPTVAVIHRSPGQPVNQAWAVAVSRYQGIVGIYALLPNNNINYAIGALGVVGPDAGPADNAGLTGPD